jgi:hypothetical protein
MDLQLEGVFYVVRPEAMSRELPVVRYSWVTVQFQELTGGESSEEFSAWIVKSASVDRRL